MMTTQTRRHATETPVWKKGWRGETRADTLRRFTVHNPFFTKRELVDVLGEGHDATAESFVQAGKLRRVATGIYCSIAYDQSHPELVILMQQEGATPASGDAVARQTDRIMRHEARTAADEIAKDGAADTLARMRAKVYSRADARDKLGFNPDQALDRLLRTGSIREIHPGLFRRATVSLHGSDLLDWAREHSRRMGDIARSLDLCLSKTPADARRGTPTVTSMFTSDATRDRPQTVVVNIKRLGTIYAIAGGKGRTTPLWKANEERTGLSPDAAEYVGRELFGRDATFGDLMGMVAAYDAEKDVAKRTLLLPVFREKGPFDYSARLGERGDGVRLTRIRELADQGEVVIPRECVLYADDREDARIVDALRGVEGLHVVSCRLEEGDFLVRWGEGASNQVLIERKTAPDFEKSIQTGRMADQTSRMERMVTGGTTCLFIQQGCPFTWSTVSIGDARGFPTVQVRSADKTAASLALARAGVRTINVETWQMAAKTIVDVVAAFVPSLPQSQSDPKIPLEGIDGCANPGNIAAERPDAQSSV